MRSRNVTRSILAVGLAVSIQLALGRSQCATGGDTGTGGRWCAAARPRRGSWRRRFARQAANVYVCRDQRANALCPVRVVQGHQGQKNPLIVSLHGLGGDQNTMVRESLRSVELAEQGGDILVAPMGYNSRLVRHPCRSATRDRSESESSGHSERSGPTWTWRRRSRRDSRPARQSLNLPRFARPAKRTSWPCSTWFVRNSTLTSAASI